MNCWKILGIKKEDSKESEVGDCNENIHFYGYFKRLCPQIRYFVPLVLCIIVSIFLVSRNYYKGAYQRQEAVSLEEALADSYQYYKAGYPAGKNIPVARSVADIMEYPCFTIEVSVENLIPIREFRIKNFSEAGIRGSTKRGARDVEIEWYYWLSKDSFGDILYALRQVDWNMDEVSYGEYCVITLESGERILALIDLQLLELPNEGTIMLPIGKMRDADSDPKAYLGKYSTYQVDTEEGYWYVDMVGEWEEKEVGNRPTLLIYIVCFIATIINISMLVVQLQERSKSQA